MESLLRDILRLYDVDAVPNELTKDFDVSPQELDDRRVFHHFWLAHFLGNCGTPFQTFVNPYRQKIKNTKTSFLAGSMQYQDKFSTSNAVTVHKHPKTKGTNHNMKITPETST